MQSSQAQAQLYDAAVQQLGAVLDRLAAGYEADPDKRLDLRQEIHLQLWRSLALFDDRCSLRTWTLRVAHNTAVSHVHRQRRRRLMFVSLEEAADTTAPAAFDLERQQALDQLHRLISRLKPLDRQIMLSYLEGLDAASISEITGLSSANVAMKIHRIKELLGQLYKDAQHA